MANRRQTAARGEHLGPDRPKREDVGARVRGTAAHLLRGHVRDGPENGAAHGREVPVGVAIAGRNRGEQLGQSKVEDLQAAILEQEEVLRLEVAVQDTVLVGGGEAARELQGEIRRLWRLQRSFREPRAQRAAAQELRTMKGTPSCTPTSWSARTLGCSSAPA